MKTLTFALVSLLVIACGAPSTDAPAPEATPAAFAPASLDTPSLVAEAPAPAPTASPTATPTPNPTIVQNYIPQDNTICTAIRNWDPNTTIINAYTGPIAAGTTYYSFRWDGVWVVSSSGGCTSPGICAAGSNAPLNLVRSNINGVVCTITVVNGQLQGVTL